MDASQRSVMPALGHACPFRVSNSNLSYPQRIRQAKNNLARTDTQTREEQTTTECWPIDTPFLCACMLHKRAAQRLVHYFRLWFTNVCGSLHLHANLPGICLRNASANLARSENSSIQHVGLQHCVRVTPTDDKSPFKRTREVLYTMATGGLAY
jgi:hypothetical protein